MRSVRRAGNACILLFALSLPVHAVRFGLALAPGDPAPRILLPLVTGGEERYRHDWSQHSFTVVNFWATWCKPCREEMPALQRLVEAHRDERLAVVGILLDPRADDEGARAFLEDLGIRYPAVRGDLAAVQAWGGIGMFPTTFLVDREGKIVRRYVGASPAQIQGLVGDVEAVLAGRPLGSMVMPESPPPEPDAP